MDVEIELDSRPEIIERTVIGIPNAAVRKNYYECYMKSKEIEIERI